MKQLLAAILTCFLCSVQALAQSSVNPSVPATDALLASAPIRGNFNATYNDINGILGMHAVSTIGACSVQTQTIGADCLVENSATNYVWYKWMSATTGYVVIGNINPSTNPPTFTPGYGPIPNAQIIANCSGATASPGPCAWTTLADQAISATNGSIPYRSGGSWGTILVGTSGSTIPLNNTSNIFSALQAINLNGSSLPSAQTGAMLQLQQANSTSGRVELDTYAASGYYSCVRADGTAASQVALIDNEEICAVNAWGYDGATRGGPAGTMRIYSGGTWTSSSHPTYIDFGVTAASSTTTTSAFQIQSTGGLVSTGVTGGDKGLGTINVAGNYYVGGNVASTTVNGQSCALGGTCTITASAASITIGTTTVAGGAGVLYNTTTGGALAALSPVNNSVFSFNGSGVPQASTTLPSGLSATNLSLTTPTLGVAAGTSLALGGAGIGGNVLALTGSSLFNGAIISQSASTVGLCISNNGTNCALGVDTSTASSATGWLIKSAAAGGGAALSVTSTGTNEGGTINAKGSGALSIGNVSTGAVNLGNGGGGVGILSALTYGGVTFANTVSGSGSLVGNASPAFTGTVGGSFTLSGSIIHSGIVTFNTQAIFQSTSAPTTASGNTNVLGTLAGTLTLANTGQGDVFNTAVGGLNLQGDGSTDDIRLINKSGQIAMNVPTGGTGVNFPGALTATGLTTGTCSSGLALNASNQIVLDACPGAASSVQVTATSVTSATANTLLGPGTVSGGTGTLSSVSAGAGLTISPTSIALSMTNAAVTGTASSVTALTSGSVKMMGLGVTTCRFTTSYETRAYINITGGTSNSTTGTTTMQVAWADAAVTAAPANAAAQPGGASNVGAVPPFNYDSGNFGLMIGGGIITGLTPGHTYWFDGAISASAGSQSFSGITCSAIGLGG